MKLFCALLLSSIFCATYGQTPEVSISQAPAPNAYQINYGYSNGNLAYACYARSVSQIPSLPVTISAATNANPVVFTSTGHGFNTNSRPLVNISGGTGNWAAVNGTFTATIINANTFSIPVNSTSFSSVTGTLVYTTFAPRTNQPVWSVLLYSYDGSGDLIFSAWLGGNATFNNLCSNATSTTLNVQ